jgi:hypothetical protein
MTVFSRALIMDDGIGFPAFNDRCHTDSPLVYAVKPVIEGSLGNPDILSDLNRFEKPFPAKFVRHTFADLQNAGYF